MMKRSRLMVVVGMTAMVTGTANAQNVTYNHDSSKKNQITVMETGAGTLTPELYYWTLHNSYKKTAVSKNKLGYRTAAGISAYNQVAYAEAIDSALTSRAKIEALNVADRQIDLAWLAESSKIETAMERFKQNIDRILSVGGTVGDKQRWEEYYKMYQCAVSATKEAYMPNAQRKKEYLRIYEDVARQNETLVQYLVRLHSASQTNALLSATNERRVEKGSIVNEAKERWRQAAQAGD